MYKLFSQVVGDVDTTLSDVMRDLGRLFKLIILQSFLQDILLFSCSSRRLIVGIQRTLFDTVFILFQNRALSLYIASYLMDRRYVVIF